MLKDQNNLFEPANSALTKYNTISSSEHEFRFISDINEISKLIAEEDVPLIFSESSLEESDISALQNLVTGIEKELPCFIFSSENYHSMKEIISKDKIINYEKEFTEDLFFQCLKNILTPPDQKIDIRYIKGILTSVVKVILENTKVKLSPGHIVESKSKDVTSDICAVIAYYGDGVYGSININTTIKLISYFATKMLNCEEKDLSDEMLVDLMGEISNQIMGVFKTGLAKNGYNLSSSMMTVTLGKKFLFSSSSVGKYYLLPFKLKEEEFDINFCYNTYKIPLTEIAMAESEYKNQFLDVRLLNKVFESVESVFKANLSCEVKKGEIFKQLTNICPSNSIHLFHAGGSQGVFTMGFEVPNKTAAKVLKHMIGTKEEFIENLGVNDMFCELINQTAGEFIKSVKPQGYNFNRIFLGGYCSLKEPINYLLKNPGLYLRVIYYLDDLPFVLCFGTRSTHCGHLFNAWSYYSKLDNFNTQIDINEKIS